MRPRVFVSSVMDQFEEYRAAARRGILEAGASPVLVEDLESQPSSARNACLDLVGSCDAAVFIVGRRGGFRAPSGKLVVEEELDEAIRLGLPTVAFLQGVGRDEAAGALARRLSDYVSGLYRREFCSPEDLADQVRSAVKGVVATVNRPEQDPSVVQHRVEEMSNRDAREPRFRLVLAPSVEDQVIDPLDLEEKSLANDLVDLAHRAGFFDRRYGLNPELGRSRLLLVEKGDDSHRSYLSTLEMTTSGILVLERAVTNDDESSRGFSRESWRSFEIVVDEVLATIASSLGAAQQIVDHLDPHRRYPAWLYNATLTDIGQRRIVDAASKGASSFTARMRGAGSIIAYDEPRRISRDQLAQVQSEADRTLRLLRRGLEEADNISSF